MCQAAYDQCKQDLTATQTSPCVPLSTAAYSKCGATVELLSACLNEIANTHPIAACVTTSTCATAADAGAKIYAGSRLNGVCLKSDGGPSLPACTRLQQECPQVIFNPYAY